MLLIGDLVSYNGSQNERWKNDIIYEESSLFDLAAEK